MMYNESRPRPRSFLDCFKLPACPPTRKQNEKDGTFTFEFACGVTVDDGIAQEMLYDGYDQGQAKIRHLKHHPETQV